MQATQNTANRTKISAILGIGRKDDDMSNENEIRLFLHAEATAGVAIDLRHWWSVILKSFETMEKLAQT